MTPLDEGRAPTGPAPGRHLVQQAGQIVVEGVRLGVFRTVADEDGARAVLRVRQEGSAEVLEVAARPRSEVVLEGIGVLGVLEIRPSTVERRGAVLLELCRTAAPDGPRA